MLNRFQQEAGTVAHKLHVGRNRGFNIGQKFRPDGHNGVRNGQRSKLGERWLHDKLGHEAFGPNGREKHEYAPV